MAKFRVAGEPITFGDETGADALTVASRGTSGVILDDGGAVFNVASRRFGAVGDGLTDDTAAIRTAIQAAHDEGGGVVQLSGTHKITEPLDLSGRRNVRLVGGLTQSGGVGGRGCLRFTTALNGQTAINLASSHGVSAEGVAITTDQTSGTLVGYDTTGSDPAYSDWRNCYFEGPDGAGPDLFNLDRLIIASFRDCQFWGGSRALRRVNSYANVITIDNCTFGHQAYAPILNPGQAWNIRGCTFEPCAGPSASQPLALDWDGTIPGYAYGLVFEGNWIGDGGGGTAVKVFALGCQITANYFGAVSTAVHLLSACQGVVIAGNRFETPLGILAEAYTRGGAILGNDFGGATPIDGVDNFRGTVLGNNNQADLLKASSGTRPIVSGSRGGNAALASLLAALVERGDILDGTTA